MHEGRSVANSRVQIIMLKCSAPSAREANNLKVGVEGSVQDSSEGVETNETED